MFTPNLSICPIPLLFVLNIYIRQVLFEIGVEEMGCKDNDKDKHEHKPKFKDFFDSREIEHGRDCCSSKCKLVATGDTPI